MNVISSDRAEVLCSLGQTVMISNFQEYYKVVEYFANYTKARMGLAMGVNNLVDILMKNTIAISVVESLKLWKIILP
jgi:hypothetical protein